MNNIYSRMELTFKAVTIGIVLAIILCGANIYLGLKIGQTISASIPASIFSMAVLRMFKRYTILENNISQTIASVGDAIASVTIFVMPVLLILGVCQSFDYWSIFTLAICGGAIGICFSVLLRNVLINNSNLSFPEGYAIAQILLNNKSNKSNLITLIIGVIVSSAISFCQTGFQILVSSYYKMFHLGKNVIIGMGCGFSPALIGAGYLIGFNGTVVSLTAVLFCWCCLVPIFTYLHPVNIIDNVDHAFNIWKLYIRSIGIGVMVFGGIATLITLIKPICCGIKDLFSALHIDNMNAVDKNLNLKLLFSIAIAACIPITWLINNHIGYMIVGISPALSITLSLVVILVMLIIGFVLCAVSGYFAGLVGSSTSPLSGLLFIAVIALAIFVKFVDHILDTVSTHDVHHINIMCTLIVFVLGSIGFAAVITNDNIQDFKSCQLINGSPYKQQISLFFGLVAAACVAPLFINLVFKAYGIAGVVSPGGDPNHTLSAPQASAIAMLIKNIVLDVQDWSLILYGTIIGTIALIIDIIGKKLRKFHCPILMVGCGIYLPPDIIVALFIGGALKFYVTRYHARNSTDEEESSSKINLLMCGLIAGESIMGLILSIPFIATGNSNVFKIFNNTDLAGLFSAVVIIALVAYSYRLATQKSCQ